MKRVAVFVLGIVTAILGCVEIRGEEKARMFEEMTGGIGTVKYWDRTATYGMWAPSVGVQLNDRWAIGARMTFPTGGIPGARIHTVTSLYGQYAFVRNERWSIFAEGKGSYYYLRRSSWKGGEIGVALGGKYDVTRNLGIVLHYVYAGVEVGKDKVRSSPAGCIGKKRAMLDLSPRRLQLGVRYTF